MQVCLQEETRTRNPLSFEEREEEMEEELEDPLEELEEGEEEEEGREATRSAFSGFFLEHIPEIRDVPPP